MKAAQFSAIFLLVFGALAWGGPAMAADKAVPVDGQSRHQATRGGKTGSGGLYHGLVLRERVLPSPTVPGKSGPVEPAKCPASRPPSRNTPGHDPSEASRDGTCA